MPYYQPLLLIFLSISSTLAWMDYEINRGVGEPLYEPVRIDLTQYGSKLTLYVRLCKYSVTDNNGFLYIRMTRYCYCTDKTNDESCSYPGPTLVTKGNTQIYITFVNQLTGETSTTDDIYWNHFKDMDTVNVHTHGLHVSPFQDNVLIKCEPGTKHKYTYSFGYHYPGTFWYHTHHHGSISLQLDAGLHGAIIMTSNDIYEQKIQATYKENILMFNWQYPITKSECIPDAERGGSGSQLCPGRSPSNTEPENAFKNRNTYIEDASLCYVYCQMPTFQLDASKFVYDLETDLQPKKDSDGTNKYDILYFTNGQLEPIINDLEIGIFRRLRLINSISAFFIQFHFPHECNAYLIAIDGIYIVNEYKNFDLSKNSHLNELLVPPGGRADVLIKCETEGIYGIYSSENNEQDPAQLPKLDRIRDGYKLFSIKVNNYNNDESYGVLPHYYPELNLYGTYLQDLEYYKYTNTICDCHRPFPNKDFNANSKCIFELESAPDRMNGKPFDIRNSEAPLHLDDSLSIIRYNSAYEFDINNENGHVYHQHTNPWQYMHNIGKNGFIALKGIWGDSIGNYGHEQTVVFRAWTRDFWGFIVQHCHIIEHEDEGMMGFFNILPDDFYSCPFHDQGMIGNNNNNKNNNNNNGNSNYFNEKNSNYGDTNIGSISSDSNSGSNSDSNSYSAEFNYEEDIDTNKATSLSMQNTNMIILFSLTLFTLFCALFILGGVFYRKHKRTVKGQRTRVPTNEDYIDSDSDCIDDDESISNDEGQIVELVESRPTNDTNETVNLQ